MKTLASQQKRRRGQQLSTAEKMQLTQELVKLLEQGYKSDLALAKELGVNTTTIRRYKPYADEIIRNTKLDRNFLRNLQIQRTQRLIERLAIDLDNAETAHEKSMIHNNIIKYFQHLALITGLNVETQVHVDPKKLVIIRPPRTEKGTPTPS
ncbi:MAG TPA: hypothetical protein VJR27_00130 [Candidatus Saccharimonadales bacterium]|nr:hypothetical protein [Candidatus Saccharimonadales bacterium]